MLLVHLLTMPITASDCAKAGELIRFLERIGFNQLATEFDKQWNAQIEKQEQSAEKSGDGAAITNFSQEPVSVSLKHSSDSIIEAEARPKPQKNSSTTTTSLKVLRKRHMVVSCQGDTSELYAHTEQKLAPSFIHGAGFALDDYSNIIKESIEMVTHKPYTKKAPASDLPVYTVPLQVVFQKGKTGLEAHDEFPIIEGDLIAGRYRVVQFLDSAAFSRTVSCVDERTKRTVCLKIVRNSKENFDQSLDEIKLLLLLNEKGDPNENCILRLHDFFYFKEHLFLVTELLLDNLYLYGKHNREKETKPYFTLPRIQSIVKQVLTALRFLHSHRILHCDLKPENILFKSYKNCQVKVIDFGSSCYTTDSLGSYVQSRNYRSPEVILGCKYDTGIDIWSLGVIIPELATGKLLLNNESVPALLASITALCGPLPVSMLHEGRNTPFFVTKHGVFYERINGQVILHFPVDKLDRSKIFGFDDPEYIQFVEQCLVVDPKQRPSAEELLQHPFLHKDYGSCCCEWSTV